MQSVSFFISPVTISIKKMLPMAADAPTHVQLDHRLQHIHVPNIPMAAFAIQSGCQVRLMGKVDEARQLVDTHPRDWFAALPVIRQSPDTRIGA